MNRFVDCHWLRYNYRMRFSPREETERTRVGIRQKGASCHPLSRYFIIGHIFIVLSLLRIYTYDIFIFLLLTSYFLQRLIDRNKLSSERRDDVTNNNAVDLKIEFIYCHSQITDPYNQGSMQKWRINRFIGPDGVKRDRNDYLGSRLGRKKEETEITSEHKK